MTKAPILTQDEKSVLIMVDSHPYDKHLSNKEIGACLGMPVCKVKDLLHSAFVKLGACNRHGAILIATKLGEISIAELNYSLDELSDMLISLGPDTLREIADIVRLKKKCEYDRLKYVITIRRRVKRKGRLTESERRVLILSSRGMTNREIASELWISISAVRTYLYRIYKKLGTNKKTDAFVSALKQGELSIDEFYSFEDVVRQLSPLGAESIEAIALKLEERGAT